MKNRDSGARGQDGPIGHRSQHAQQHAEGQQGTQDIHETVLVAQLPQKAGSVYLFQNPNTAFSKDRTHPDPLPDKKRLSVISCILGNWGKCSSLHNLS